MNCLLDREGALRCWGGEFGVGTIETFRAGESRRFTSVTGGATHICATASDSTAYCMGDNRYGQLGDRTTSERLEPTPISGPATLVSLSAAVFSTCGLDPDGAAHCWGRNDVGALGNGFRGGLTFRSAPAPVKTDVRFQALSGGWANCGIDFEGRAHCWGGIPGSLDDMYRPPGDCLSAYYPWYDGEFCLTPTPVETSARFTTLANDRCGISAEGEGWCWGIGTRGTFGDGRSWAFSVPAVQVSGGIRFTGLAASASTICGLDESGAAWCWGNNFRGQLGIGEVGATGGIGFSAVPVRVDTDQRFTEIAGADSFMCALAVDDNVWCWGLSDDGLMGPGPGDGEDAPRPVRVLLQLAGGS